MTFEEELIATLPRLRVYALSLTRNKDRADELVQQVTVRALAKKHLYKPDTNLPAWLFRMQRNEFISDIRRTRDTTDLDDPKVVNMGKPADQDTSMRLREMVRKIMLLPREQRWPLVLAILDGRDYEDIGRVLNMSVGTVKSRISRARDALGDL